MSGATHPLLGVLIDAADGFFPPEDGAVEQLPELRPGLHAVVSFTAHAYLATSAFVGDLDLDGYGSALSPEVLQRIAGAAGAASAAGEIGTLDATLVARGLGGGRLPLREHGDEHPRVVFARAQREDVRVFGDDRGLITLSSGLAGRAEMSVEVTRPGTGRELIAEALRLTPPGAPLFAAVAPGNARSLRAFLAVGFAPIGSEVVLRTSAQTT